MTAEIARIPSQAERDREEVVKYLIETAGHIAAGRTKVDPYGVVVVFVGPDGVDVGSRGMVYEHNYLRAIEAFQEKVDATRKRSGRICWVCGAERPPRVDPPGPPSPPTTWGCTPEHMAEARAARAQWREFA